MKTLWLHLRAPFAAFRWMQAGVYRATSPVIPPSAAWGLVLNLASIETREESNKGNYRIRQDAPSLSLAVGDVAATARGTLYQQLHSYPVGTDSGKELKPRTRGAKYHISPVRREVLIGFNCVVGVQGPDEVLDRVPLGLAGELSESRYGLPFAGDNNLLFDSISILGSPPSGVRWYQSLEAIEESGRDSCRLTVSLDRENSSRTITKLFIPVPAEDGPPTEAWVQTPA